MKIAQSIADARADRATLGKVALVPTMGALHAGHVSLIREARRRAPHVAVSIFVNATQFGPREDYHNYPRPIEKDIAICEAEGVDLVFNPTAEEMYPVGTLPMHIDWPSLTVPLEGKFRPGHFSGVAQVVSKLFNVLQPQVALFGQKDFQQLRLIREMVNALNFAIEILPGPTLREPDGLAMSSRNAYLAPIDRAKATCIYRALQAGEAEIVKGIRQTARIMTTMQRVLLEQHLMVDYVACVDDRTMKDVEVVAAGQPVVLAVAARVNSVRLLDNMIVVPPEVAVPIPVKK